MPLQELRSNAQKLADSAEHHRVERRRAAHTVTCCVADPGEQQELLECLGLIDLDG
jgi:hypothetical protein